MIFTSLSPNAEWDDAILGLRLALSRPHTDDHAQEEILLARLRKSFAVPHAFLFESGRSALASLLRAIPLQAGDEVILQAFTCVAVPNAVLWAGGTPRYVDCMRETYTMSPEDLEKNITPKTRAVIIQHTFGIPADMDRLIDIARARNLIVIEDCAHAIGSTYRGTQIGGYGHAAILSFGRDKALSSVFGGAALARDADLAVRLQRIHAQLPYPSDGWVLRQLLHPLLTHSVKKTYGAGVGKVLLKAFRLSRLLYPAVTKEERKALRPAFAFHAMPRQLAALANHQWEKLENMNDHRRMLANIYRDLFKDVFGIATPRVPSDRDVIFLRYPLRVSDPRAALSRCRAYGIHLGDWYDSPIAPRDVALDAIGYQIGSCPMAEDLARHTINVPTSIGVSPDDARRIVACLR